MATPMFRNRGRISSTLNKTLKRRELRHKNIVRRNTNGNVNRVEANTYMDDIELLNKENMIKNEGVIFGVYGADDWVSSTFIRDQIESKTNTIALEGTWITKTGFKLCDWVEGITDRFNFISTGRAVLFMPWGGLVEAAATRGKLELQISGPPKHVRNFIAEQDAKMSRAENLIEWVYSPQGESVSVPLNYRPAVKGSFPWVDGELEDYIDDYLDSDAAVLILIGPPGTGKTTFIKSLIHRSKGDAKVTYDEKVMGDDGLFANFIEGETKFMIMEDADTFLRSRADGNVMMQRFLNVSEGLVSAQGKKLVFSTNLPSTRDIDEALLRPGRCYDVLEFRPMTREEAKVVAKELNIELPDGNEFTLAELFHQQPSNHPHETGKSRISRGMGFV